MEDAAFVESLLRLIAALWLVGGVLLACWPGLARAQTESASVGSRSVELREPAGSLRRIMLQEGATGAELASGAARLALPLPSAAVLGFGVVAPEAMARLARHPSQGVSLLGTRIGTRFRPDELEVSDPEPAAPPSGQHALPLYSPVLQRLTAAAFGDNARARLLSADPWTVRLACEPGERPAGLVLGGALAGALPAGGGGGGVRLRARGRGHFLLAVSDGARAQSEAPLSVAALALDSVWSSAEFRLPREGWQRQDWRTITMVCPALGGEIELGGLELTLDDAQGSPRIRSLWAWNPLAWRKDPELLLRRLAEVRAEEVFVTVPLLDDACQDADCRVALPELLHTFLSLAAAAHIRVWAVAGDPLAVLPAERPAWEGRARAYAAFNRTSSPEAQLAGVQYDIEHYLVPGFALAPEAWNAHYLQLFSRLRSAGGDLPIDIVVPWWFGQTQATPAALLEGLGPYVDRLTVMDYRTDPALLLESALPFLDWGQRHQHAVRVALEAGALPDTESHQYAAAAEGPLWLSTLDGQPVYVLFDRPVPRAGGAAYAARGAHRVPAARTTFFDDPDALWRAVRRLEEQFSGTRTFLGVAIHGLDAAWY